MIVSHVNNNKMECPICYDNIALGSDCKLGCNHTFHTSCLTKWRETSHTCPMCRSVITNNNHNVQISNETEPMSVVIGRFMRVLREYASSDDEDEKQFKHETLIMMVRRFHLEYDVRVCDALTSHGIPIPVN